MKLWFGRVLSLSSILLHPLNSVAYQALQSKVVTRVIREGSNRGQTEDLDVGEWMQQTTALIAFGTYAGDFNTIEYAQCLHYYWPILREEYAINKCALLVNSRPAGGLLVADSVELPSDIELWVDNTGDMARQFNVSRGWLPDVSIHPFLKLLGMMPWGLGAPGTLAAILEGYTGSSSKQKPWIQDALAIGQAKGRWPDSILDIDDDGSIIRNKFDDFVAVGWWPLRPFESATLRLQSLFGISLSNWDITMPDKEAMQCGVLTQLGGCVVVKDSVPIFEWRDDGCCAILDFEFLLQELSRG